MGSGRRYGTRARGASRAPRAGVGTTATACCRRRAADIVRRVCVLVLVLLWSGATMPTDPTTLLREGDRLFGGGEYEQAGTVFRDAADAAERAGDVSTR